MKKVLAVVCFASTMASVSAFALTFNGTNTAAAGVVASKHNMLKYNETGLSADSQGRVCAFCHTPHHALAGTQMANYMPLWSHELPTESYKAYDTTTLKVGSESLKGVTILCMSCHDGVVAVDQHYGSTPDASHVTTENNWLGAAVGKHDAAGRIDLSNDHPVGFSYQSALDTHPGDLNSKDTPFPGSATNTSGTAKKISDVLTNGDFFTCASCHDVHNKDNVGNSLDTSKNYFLYADQKDSIFCTVCHKK